MIFYDYEVFLKDWLVVFVDLQDESETIFTNDPNGLREFHRKNKNRIFVGFNNKHYDQWIHKAILLGYDPKSMNDWIINKHQSPYEFSQDINTVQMNNYDVMERIDRGLKVFEGFMGHDIKETTVPFDIDRKLTNDELLEVYEYCRHDVHETIKVFIERQKDFKAHFELVKMAGLNSFNFNKSRGNLSAYMLGAEKVKRYDDFDIKLPETLKVKKYNHICEWYLNPENQKYKIEHEHKKPTSNQLEVVVAGVPHVFAWGGLHGAREKYHGKGFFVNVDVNSMYPSLIIQYELLSRNCKKGALKTYERIYKKRLALKKQGKKDEQAPLKLFLNSTYGIMKDPNNAMYDPLMANTVCVYGQLFLLDLIEKTEEIGQLIQSNTDGLLIKLKTPDDFDKLKSVCSKWEERTGLTLDYDLFKEVWQKDVNNYIMIEPDGKIKSKGAYVKQLTKLDNDLPIVNKALIAYMVEGVPIRKTIRAGTKLIDYQMVTKISNKYQYFLHGEKKLNEKVIRVFATHEDLPSVTKKHVDGSIAKVSNAPEKVHIINDNIEDVDKPAWIDHRYYIDLANRRLKQFVEGSERGDAI